jgi:hypothetical protein
MPDDPATKQDILDLKTELKLWFMEREVSTIRWLVTTQLAYVVLTIGSVYFLLQHLR